MKTFLTTLLGLFFLTPYLHAQVGIGTTTPKAALQVTSPNSGVLIPKYATLAQANSTSLPTLNATDHKGLMIYVDEVANRGFWFYDGSAFVKVGTQTGALPIANGGTGAITSGAALNALLPAQSGNAGQLLTTDGTNANWQKPASGPRSIILDLGSIDVSAATNMGNQPDKATIGGYNVPVIGFPDNSERFIQTQMPIPADWNGRTTITITLYYCSATTAGNFSIDLDGRCMGLNSIVTGVFYTCNDTAAKASTTANGLMEKSYDISCMDLNASSKVFFMRIRRIANAPEDSATGYFNLLGIRMDY